MGEHCDICGAELEHGIGYHACKSCLDEIERLRAELAEKQRLLTKAGRDHIALQANFAAQLAAKDAVVEAAWKAVNKSVYPLDFLEDALRALYQRRSEGRRR